MPDYKPFADDAEFIDAAITVLGTRARRLALARDCWKAQQGGADDQPCPSALDKLAALITREEDQKTELDGRLAAHRADSNAHQLGLDRLAMTLDADETMVLVAAFCCAVSEDAATFAFEDLGTGFGGNGSVEFYLRLLGADSTGDRLRARQHFQADGRLVKAGLISIDTMRNTDMQPEDLLWCRVRITQAGFDAVSGAGPALAVEEPQP